MTKYIRSPAERYLTCFACVSVGVNKLLQMPMFQNIFVLKPKIPNATCVKEEERKKKFLVGVLKGRKVLDENLVFLKILIERREFLKFG